jgi:hypothetical protein
MSDWTAEELDTIGAADELRIAALRLSARWPVPPAGGTGSPRGTYGLTGARRRGAE